MTPSSEGLIPDGASRWIWSGDPQHYAINHWIDVRKFFELGAVDPQARLLLSVDTDYALWINGRFVNLGQFSDYPRQKHFDVLEIAGYLAPGRNVLAILAWHQGQNTCRYRRGRPGLIFTFYNGAETFVSDEQCVARTDPAYVSGPVPLVTRQLGLTIAYDARRDDGWRSAEYDDTAWPRAAELAGPTGGYWQSLAPRPLPKLELSPVSARLIADAARIAPTKESVGYTRALFDLGQERSGYLKLDIEAREGTIVEIAHGEHILDGGVRSHIDGRTFIDRYTCAPGRRQWLMPMRRLGCRYLELRVGPHDGPLTVHEAGLLEAQYPVETRGSFECDRPVHGRIWQGAVRTARLCLHEHYEDTPWREQALYAMDARIQALCGYYLFGDTAFAETSLRLLGQGLRKDGLLELCAPACIPLTIPVFSLAWITAVRDHALHGGGLELAREFMPQITRILAGFHARRDPVSGLVWTLSGPEYWNFYEWSPELAGELEGSKIHSRPPRPDACLNLFLSEALGAAAQLAHWLGDSGGARLAGEASEMKKSIARAVSGEGLIPNVLDGKKALVFSQLTQALALAAGIVNPDRAGRLRQQMLNDPEIERVTLGMAQFLFAAVIDEPERYGPAALELIERDWAPMLGDGTGTFWETVAGAADFDGAGSLCHGWSAAPAYFYGACVLGIRPLAPGYSRFSVRPACCGLERAQGTIPTPAGLIAVRWELNDGRYRATVNYPPALQPEIAMSAEERKDWTFELIH